MDCIGLEFNPGSSLIQSNPLRVNWIRVDGLDGLYWIGLHRTGLDWIGLDWIGVDWSGLDRTQLDKAGLDCICPDWTI